MAYAELVIKIPEETVNVIKDNAMFAKEIASSIKWDITSAIVNATPLPKGHGRLIDADALPLNYIDNANYGSNYIRIAPTIIEADKAETEIRE